MPAHDLDDLLRAVRALIEQDSTDTEALDIEFNLLGERLLDALQRADHTDMLEGWRRLQRLFEWAEARLDD
ncbi:MAG: hypothetical protein KC620_17340, partial [Myxococcales bacterium]|nr:hypothetical protein [Myxococcales bacterium]